MKILIREKLSPHKFKTPEGYLICQDAILGRTGKQTYRKNELFLDTDDASEVEVDRPYDEVFSQETLASFENKPITIEHPDEDVTIDNYKDYAVGFVRDIRQSKVDGQDVIIGNLVITDKEAIEKVENGEMVELSCGYDCDIVGDESPKQTHIRGNHLALCEQGRAGISKIIDSKVKDDWNGMIPSKKIIFNYHNGIWTITNYQTNKAVDVDERKYGSLTQEKAIDIAINQLHLNDSVKDANQNESYCEKRLKELIAIKNKRPLTDEEYEEYEYCKNTLSSIDAENRYLNGDDRYYGSYRPFDSVKDSAYIVEGEYVDRNNHYEEVNKSFSTYQKALDYFTDIRDYKGCKFCSIDMMKDGQVLATEYYGNPNIVTDSVKDDIIKLDNGNYLYKGYVIYPWSNEFRAITKGRSSFDFTGKTIEEVKAKIDGAVQDSIKDSIKDRVPDNIVREYQSKVDYAIKQYGRIGAGLYDELDDAHLWVDDRNGQYIVKRQVEDSIQDAKPVNESNVNTIKEGTIIRRYYPQSYLSGAETNDYKVDKVVGDKIYMTMIKRHKIWSNGQEEDIAPASGQVNIEKKHLINNSTYPCEIIKDSIQDSNKLFKVNGIYVSANNMVDAIKKHRDSKVKDSTPINIKARLVWVDEKGQWHSKEISHDELERLGRGNRRTEDYEGKSAGIIPRRELWNQPTLKGFLGPMYDGDAIRYENQTAYDFLSM